jgi:hypothetical protein
MKYVCYAKISYDDWIELIYLKLAVESFRQSV